MACDDRPGDDLRRRPMTEDERRGFDYALDCLEIWTCQLMRADTKLADTPVVSLSPRQLLTDRVNFTRGIAQAMRIGFP